MRPLHLLLALTVVAVWGCNFVFIKLGLQDIPPLTLCLLRFFLASIPAVFFIKRPAISFKLLFLYGLLTFGLQFIFLFMGMHAGMTPGLASLILQLQVFFSFFFAKVFLHEKPGMWKLVAALIAFSGIGVVWLHLEGQATLSGFMWMILAAMSWGAGNLVAKKISGINGMALVVWGSFVILPPLFLVALMFEGAGPMIDSITQMSWTSAAIIGYIVYLSTWFGYGTWNWLLRIYPVSTIVPNTLLVPIFGMLSSTLMLNEPLQLWKIAAGLLVITGLSINVFGPRLFYLAFRKEAVVKT